MVVELTNYQEFRNPLKVVVVGVAEEVTTVNQMSARIERVEEMVVEWHQTIQLAEWVLTEIATTVVLVVERTVCCPAAGTLLIYFLY